MQELEWAFFVLETKKKPPLTSPVKANGGEK
jgi:hypothetical protein